MQMSAPFKDPIAHTARLANDKSQPASIEGVAAIQTRCKAALIQAWLVRTNRTPELDHLLLSDEERTVHLPKLVDDLVERLSRPQLPDKDSDAIASLAHGKLRRKQCYAAAMLIHESRILQVTIFRNIAQEFEHAGFQLAVAGCHDYRR
jgi:hypothetical protein